MQCDVNSRWRPAAILDFVFGELLTQHHIETVIVYLAFKFGDNSSTGCRNMTLLINPRWRPAAILNFDMEST
jgi:hypothetical protein